MFSINGNNNSLCFIANDIATKDKIIKLINENYDSKQQAFK